MSDARRGTVLIIIAGIAALMLAVSLTFLTRMRGDGEEAAYVLRDSTARIMLVNAMAYVCETSRLGWGEETFGWNDVHDHSVGPSCFVDKDGDGVRETAEPVWVGDAWPAPGSSARCPMYVMQRPPRAITPHLGHNPMVIVDASLPAPPAGYKDGPGESLTRFNGVVVDVKGRRKMADFSVLDPQPVAGNRADFVAGDPVPRIESLDLGWFRVYRERAIDHDGLPAGSPEPYYDTVDLNGGTYPDGRQYPDNGSVFVLTCGSGATQGYRFWSTSDPGYDRALEPVTAGDSGLFQSREQFESMRAEEQLLWFRIEWSPLVGDQSGHNTYSGSYFNAIGNHREGSNIWGHNPPSTQFGSIKWIQRLDREPPRW